MYKNLTKSFDIITFDYRGYGDSTNVNPDELGVVEDTIIVIKYANEKKRTDKLFIWGHSLGSAVATESLSVLNDTIKIDAVILESPFNNLRDEIREHYFSMVHIFSVNNMPMVTPS